MRCSSMKNEVVGGENTTLTHLATAGTTVTAKRARDLIDLEVDLDSHWLYDFNNPEHQLKSKSSREEQAVKNKPFFKDSTPIQV